jgi:hypothetical protein
LVCASGMETTLKLFDVEECLTEITCNAMCTRNKPLSLNVVPPEKWPPPCLQVRCSPPSPPALSSLFLLLVAKHPLPTAISEGLLLLRQSSGASVERDIFCSGSTREGPHQLARAHAHPSQLLPLVLLLRRETLYPRSVHSKKRRALLFR